MAIRPEITNDRNLALELVRVTEAAALAASRWMGRGRKNEADGAAVEGMRRAFDSVAIDGTVVIGEGEKDEAPMLYIGEKVGSGGPEMDIAVDPLEGTSITAKGGPNALAVVALAERGNFLHAPDICETWPGPRNASWATWSCACWSGSGMPRSSPPAGRPGRGSCCWATATWPA